MSKLPARGRRCRTALALIGACLATSASTVARADPAAEAEKHRERAARAYADKDFDTAANEMRQAYELDPQPLYLFNQAQAERYRGRCDLAVPLYRKFATLTEEAPAREAAVDGLRLCGAGVDDQSATDGAEGATEPGPGEPEPTSATGPSSGASDSASAGVDLSVGTHATATSDRSPWYTDVIGGSLVVGGALFAGVGTGLLVSSRSKADAAADASTHQQVVNLTDKAESRNRWGLITLSAGGALLAGGIVRYYLVSAEGDNANAPVVSAGQGSVSISLRGRF